MDRHEPPVGLSVWDQELYGALIDHIDAESDLLARYEGLAADHPGHVQFLLELIADDEARHHRIYEQWADTIKDLGVMFVPEDGVPNLSREPDPERLIAALDELIAFEKRDARQLKELQKTLKDVRQTTIWALLPELMALDTEKHVRILEFLREHARRTARHH
jgi:rubrerythrin